MGLEVKDKITTRVFYKLEHIGRELAYVSLAVLLVILIIFVVTPLAIPLLCYRYLLKIWAACLLPNLGKMVTTRGSYFTNVDPIYVQPRMSVLSTLVLKGKLSLDTAHAALNRQWVWKASQEVNGELELPELQQYPTSWAGFFFWKWDKDFRIENHVTEYDWAKKYSKLDPETILSVNNELLTKAYAEKRSPWEAHLMFTNEGDNGESLTYVILRTHHSLGDGKSLLRLISYCCYGSGDEFINRISPKSIPAAQKDNSWAQLTRPLRHVILSPYHLVKQTFQPKDDHRLTLGNNDLCWQLNATVTNDLPVPLIKQAKNIHNVSFTSVIFAGVTGAIRNFMIENSMSVPEVMQCATPFPIPGHSDKLRNYSSFGILKLPVGLPCARSRLHYIENSFIELKNSPFPYLSFYLMSLVGAMPAGITRFLAGNSPISAHVSNIAGPIKPVDILGHELKSLWFSPANAGVGVTCLSYSDKLNLAVSIDKHILPLDISIKSIMDKLLEEFSILCAMPST